jgi:hypothetical protein
MQFGAQQAGQLTMRFLSSGATCFLVLYGIDHYLFRGVYLDTALQLAIQIGTRF